MIPVSMKMLQCRSQMSIRVIAAMPSNCTRIIAGVVEMQKLPPSFCTRRQSVYVFWGKTEFICVLRTNDAYNMWSTLIYVVFFQRRNPWWQKILDVSFNSCAVIDGFVELSFWLIVVTIIVWIMHKNRG